MKKLKSFPFFSKEAAFELPFFISLTVVMLGIAAWSISDSPALREPTRLVTFIALMLIHTALYWMTVWLPKDLKWNLGYLALQGAIAFVITLIAGNLAVVFGLYMGLVGITVGLLRLTRWGVTAIAFLLVLSLVSFTLESGWSQSDWWVVGVIPTTLFVIIYVTLYLRQNEARTQAQALAAELEAANRQLADYAGRVEDLTLANERQRMARELHDTLSQGLAGLILQLEAAQAHLEQGRVERGGAIVSQAMVQARATLADARRAIGDLRQAEPEARDLCAALRAETGRFSQATGIPCQVEMGLSEDECAALPGGLCEPVRRVVAEALTNIGRHARASQCQVSLKSADGWLEVRVVDDGAGFNPAADAGQAGHYGLLGMRERARLAGGTLEVISGVGEGTTVKMRVPTL